MLYDAGKARHEKAVVLVLVPQDPYLLLNIIGPVFLRRLGLWHRDSAGGLLSPPCVPPDKETDGNRNKVGQAKEHKEVQLVGDMKPIQDLPYPTLNAFHAGILSLRSGHFKGFA